MTVFASKAQEQKAIDVLHQIYTERFKPNGIGEIHEAELTQIASKKSGLGEPIIQMAVSHLIERKLMHRNGSMIYSTGRFPVE